MLKDFLKTHRPPSELKTALDVIREFRDGETRKEWMETLFVNWAMLERLEGYLDKLTRKNKGEHEAHTRNG